MSSCTFSGGGAFADGAAEAALAASRLANESNSVAKIARKRVFNPQAVMVFTPVNRALPGTHHNACRPKVCSGFGITTCIKTRTWSMSLDPFFTRHASGHSMRGSQHTVQTSKSRNYAPFRSDMRGLRDRRQRPTL